MDPNATLQLIFDSMEANDNDQFQESFADLGNWLLRGGFVPTCNGLPVIEFKTFKPNGGTWLASHKLSDNRNRWYAIKRNDNGSFNFLILNNAGEITGSYPMPRS